MATRQEEHNSLDAELRKLGWWYQDFLLPDGSRTGDGSPPSYEPETRWRLFEPHLPPSFEGATVLDVGGNAGYFSLQFALRGAAECVIVEPFVEFADQACFVSKAFDVNFTVVREDVLSYVLSTDRKFDYVLFLGLFYHLRYPTLVLDRLAQMASGMMLFHTLLEESVTGEPVLPEETAASPAGDALPDSRVTFLEESFRGDPTNWWVPTSSAMQGMLRSAGLDVLARPHPELFVTKPNRDLGVYRKGSLVLSNYVKNSHPHTIYPGTQHVDPKLWADLVRRRWKEG